MDPYNTAQPIDAGPQDLRNEHDAHKALKESINHE